MRIIEKKIYKFHELSEQAKQKAIDWYRQGNLDYEWWDYTYGDAKNIGLEVDGFDLYRRTIEGKLISDVKTVIKEIMQQHGKECSTYKTAQKYFPQIVLIRLTELDKTEEQIEEFLEDLTEKFKEDLLKDYLNMLEEEEEYLQSDENCIKSIEANEYKFDEDGNIA